VPVGADLLDFNRHRIYGHARLPLLLKGWTIVALYGFAADLLDQKGRIIQPFFLLRNSPPECGRTDEDQWCSLIPGGCWPVPQTTY